MSSILYTKTNKKRLLNIVINKLLCSINVLQSIENIGVFSNNSYENGFENLLFFSTKKTENKFPETNKWSFGAVSYDYKNYIDNLKSDHFDGIEFDDVTFVEAELVISFKESGYTILYSENPLLQKNIEAVLNSQANCNGKLRVPSKITSQITKQSYLKAVEELQKHIRRGDIYEVNYCYEYFIRNADINPFFLYLKLMEESPTPFSAFLKVGDKYVISASPERFLKKTGNTIISEPIKGTAKRDLSSKQNDERLKTALQNSVKERSENIMIVDLVRNDLSRIACRNSVKVDELCGIYSFPQVHQMISTISAQLPDDIDLETIFKATFPPGSMTGAPKIRAMELIETYEKTKRGLYAGTVGYVKPSGDFDFNVVIRSILYHQKNKYLSFMVGGAITYLSDPEKEYEETLLKASAIMKILKNG